ncbi:MAG: hypothetical protein ACR2IH_07325 [Pyrinomonadaceae bacterium]
MRERNAMPFTQNTFARTNPNTTSISWGYFLLTIACASLMAAGFFFAARQHFNAMDIGFNNSRLRKQVEELNAEKRRLTLAREIALSPSEIRKSARSLGFRERESVVVTTTSASAHAKTDKIVPVRTHDAAERPIAVKAVKAVYTEAPGERSIKKIVMQRTSQDRLVALR